MLIDTHCHLNFKAFTGRVEEVINDAKKVGVNNIIVPGTDVLTSQKAVEIAEKYPGVYAAVGIHPHHVIQYQKSNIKDQKETIGHPEFISGSQKEMPKQVRHDINEIEKLLSNPKVVAIGEVGIDKHEYKKTVYKVYKVHKEFIDLQKDLFIEQIKLAAKYKKTLIIHNREAKKDVLEIITNHRSLITSHSAVFHCCEPDKDLLDFAVDRKMFIGVDGDITYRKDKQEFIKKIPIDMLVLETDSPFLSPRLLSIPRPWIRYNEPKNIPIIAGFIASLLHCSIDGLEKQTTENAKRLFKIELF